MSSHESDVAKVGVFGAKKLRPRWRIAWPWRGKLLRTQIRDEETGSGSRFWDQGEQPEFFDETNSCTIFGKHLWTRGGTGEACSEAGMDGREEDRSAAVRERGQTQDERAEKKS
jgi:hypothetical protein